MCIRDSQCVAAARGDLGPAPTEIVLGTRHELGLSWLVPMLPLLREEHPHVTFHLYVGSGPDLEDRIRSQQVDCAVSSRRIHDPGIDFLKLHEEDYCFVGSPELLARHPFAQPEDAAQHTLIDTSPETPLFGYWRDAPGGLDSLHFSGLLRMGTIAAIHALVVHGDGVAVLPAYLVTPDIQAGLLTRIMPAVTPLSDHFRLLFRANDPRRPIFESLARLMLEQPLR